MKKALVDEDRTLLGKDDVRVALDLGLQTNVLPICTSAARTARYGLVPDGAEARRF